MRTCIFVYANSIDYVLRPEISAVVKYNGPGNWTTITTKNDGTITLAKGIYKIVTDDPVNLRPVNDTSGNYDIVVVPNNKDPFPDPPAKSLTAFPSVTTAELRAFLPEAFDAFDTPASP